MSDLKSPRLMYLKAALLLAIGVVSSVLLLLFAPDWRVAVLLALAVWAFCRAYYFAFYVIEHYIDGEYSYSGLFDFAKCQALGRGYRHRATGRDDEQNA
ncbi:hypothetical protein [Aeoliella sp.]|uniref:hypothetical protein n=1 Tax=Aeoliella sp. TaxID=2795800 RepID=UPI003CCB9C0C